MYERYFEHFKIKVPLTEEEQEFIKKYLTVKKLRKRQYLLQEGDVCKAVAFVERDVMRLYRVNEDSTEHIVAFALEGSFMADLYSFLTQSPSQYHIDCLEDTEVLQISKANQDLLYEQVPKMERFFRILIQNAYIASTNRISSTLSKSARERYDEFLVKYPGIGQRVPDHQIASYLGLTPQSLSRIRNKMASKN